MKLNLIIGLLLCIHGAQYENERFKEIILISGWAIIIFEFFCAGNRLLWKLYVEKSDTEHR